MKEEKIYSNIDIGFLTPIFRLKIVVIITNWIFQGLLYADRTEKTFKITFDLLLTALLFLIIPNSDLVIGLTTSFFISHSFNWIFNGQLFALAKNFRLVHNEPERIIKYADGIKNRASNNKSINCVAVYGSLVRGEIKSTSDLDMRIIRNPGILNGFYACIFGFKERFRALVSRFPLDLYVIDSPKHLLKMSSNEVPEILYDPTNILNMKK